MAKTAALGIRCALAVALGLAAIGCGGGTSMVETPVSISISPSAAELGPGQTFQFSSRLTGTRISDVIWSVNGVAGGTAAAGTISAAGLYTSPSTGPSQQVTVTARSAADTSKSASATVTVVAAGTVSTTANPQVAEYSVVVPQDATVSVEFGPDTNYGRSTSALPTPSGGGEVDTLVAGMKAFSTYHMRAVIQFSDGTSLMDSDHTFETGGLSAERVPATAVTLPTPGLTPAGGVELLALTQGPNNLIEAAAVDQDGSIIWYYDFPSDSTSIPFPIKLLDNGHMMIQVGFVPGFAPGPSYLREIDLAGNTVRDLEIADLDQRLANAGFTEKPATFHHDFAVLPNGHIIVLVCDVRTISGQVYFGDDLVDLDPNLNPVWVWSAFDHLDLTRAPMGLPDWTHANAVIYSPDDGNLLFSMRNQSWVIKIDYQDGKGSGDVLWHLGYQGDFALQNGQDPIDWFYAQHYPTFLSANTTGQFTLGVFDNGNNRVVDTNGDLCGTPTTVTCYSRGVILDVDETAKTATLAYQDHLPVFSICCGNIQVLSNNDLETDAGAVLTGSRFAAHVYERTQEATPQTVWQLDVTSGQIAYRAFRIPSLYPGVQW